MLYIHYTEQVIFLQVPVRYRTIEHFSSKVEWNCRIWIGRGIAYNMFLENFCSRRKGYILLLQQSNMAELSWMKRVDIYREVVPFNTRRPKIQNPKPADAIATSPASSVAVIVEFAFK